ncbi:MAG: putative RNA methyltransferase [Erysipelotrichaceae bacterium]
MNLKCPLCEKQLIKNSKTFTCLNNHCFDIAKQGYLNLHMSSSQKNFGDDKEMVEARANFLNKGYYLSLKNKLNTIMKQLNIETLVDCACGEGYYTKDFPVASIGVDLSKAAIIRASKVDQKNQYLISSIFKLPLYDKCTDAITVLFAPIAIKEIERLLKDEGYLISVSTGPNHLWQLKEVLYAIPYKNQINNPETSLKKINTYKIHKKITLTNQEDINNLFKMTPYYYKTSLDDKSKLNKLNYLETEIEFIINVYQNKL